MKKTIFKFDNTYVGLPNTFYKKTQPTLVKDPTLIIYNKSLAHDLNINNTGLSDSDLAQLFSGNKMPVGTEPIAMAYAGHQFAHFVPQLGDGRAILLGEVVGKDKVRYDIQLKGAGQTPFSRRGDGRSSLGPVLREYLVSEAMFRLNVPTTRSLAAILTGEDVYREEALPGAVLTRVATSHIRVGTFEYFAARNDQQGLATLLNYSVKRHYPELESSKDLSRSFLVKAIERQADLVAQWMSLGFIHGVMNTDNCSIGGLTIDYGPCAFMDHYNASKVFSSIDRNGRYAYNQQPDMALWNLARLADTLLVLDRGDNERIKLFEKELMNFKSLFKSKWLKLMGQKLGIINPKQEDEELIHDWLNYLEAETLDFTLSFRKLASCLNSEKKCDYLKPTAQFLKFKQQLKLTLEKQGSKLNDVALSMNKVNPIYIPRNHKIEQVIEKALSGDYSMFHELNQVLQNPFFEQPELESYARPPLSSEEVKATFCGT